MDVSKRRVSQLSAEAKVARRVPSIGETMTDCYSHDVMMWHVRSKAGSRVLRHRTTTSSIQP